MSNSGVSAPIHVSTGNSSGDVTYSLGFDTNQMEGHGTVDGQPFEEVWTFGPQLKVDGKIGSVEEHLTAARPDGTHWHVTGTVGQNSVTQDTTEWSKAATEGYIVDTNGAIPWTASGNIFYPDNPNAPPPPQS